MSARDRHVEVYVDLAGTSHHVGELWARVGKTGRESATFKYDVAWMENPERFALEPALALGPGDYQTQSGQSLFGALGDSAPDRWGRALMRRAERRRADSASEPHRTLNEIDYLLLVNDQARQGALRFKDDQGGPFLADRSSQVIPPLVELPRLLHAADRIANDSEDDEDLRLLLAPGSSLGGA